MTIQNLRYIIEIARCNSISKAAKSLFMTQSAISAAVKETEDELGIQIFNRTSHGVTLTFDGEEFLVYCKEIVAKMDYVQNRYQNRAMARTSFSVSSQHIAFAVRAYRSFLEHFTAASFDLSLRELPIKELFHDVSSGQSELGLFLFRDDQAPEIRKSLYLYDLAYTELAQPAVYVFFSKNHPLADHACLTPEDLNPYPCLTFHYRNGTEPDISDALAFTGFDKCIHVNDKSTLLALLQNNHSFFIDIELSIDPGMANAISAVPLYLQNGSEVIHAGYAVQKKHALSAPCQQYIALLQQECQTISPL